MNGVAYFLGALAGGCLIDRYAARAARQRVMGSGWVLMCISYACFGPLAALPASDVTQLAFIILGMFGQVSDLDGPSIPSNDLDCLSSLIIVGMIGQGVGAGAIIVPSLPDAQDGLRTELDKAAVVAVWNSCLAGGGAVGPVLAAALTERYGFDLMATSPACKCSPRRLFPQVRVRSHGHRLRRLVRPRRPRAWRQWVEGRQVMRQGECDSRCVHRYQ